jgi:hypothetical protein
MLRAKASPSARIGSTFVRMKSASRMSHPFVVTSSARMTAHDDGNGAIHRAARRLSRE